MSDFSNSTEAESRDLNSGESISSPNEDAPVPKKKLPYFHRTLSDEDNALLGDIRPKQISAASSSATQAAGKLDVASNWNAAQTWESRNCSEWAKSTLESTLAPFEVSDSNISIEIDSVDDVSGHAEMVHTRGKLKRIFDFSITLKGSVTAGDKAWKGKFTLDSVMPSATTADDLELTISWEGSSPGGKDYPTVARATTGAGSLLRRALEERLQAFEQAYAEKQ